MFSLLLPPWALESTAKVSLAFFHSFTQNLMLLFATIKSHGYL